MAVGRDYMLKKSRGPSPAKLFLDTKMVPVAVNTAGWVEVALQRMSVRTGVRSSTILAGSLGVLSLALYRLLRDRDPVNRYR